MATAKKDAIIYQLKINLRDAKPPIWRRVQVRSTTTLGKLHTIIQQAMGWYDCHMYEFEVDGQHYGKSMPDLDIKSDRNVRLSSFIPGEKYKFFYLYDMGAGWLHQILVEKVLVPEVGARYPICIKGKRACPPEDCGGIWGYADFLDVIRDPNHAEHHSMLEWIGGSFDPEALDLNDINQALSQMRS